MNLLHRLEHPGSAKHLALWRIAISVHLIGVFSSPSLWFLKDFGAKPHELANSWLPVTVFHFTASYLELIVPLGLIGTVAMLIGLYTRCMAVLVLLVFLLTQNYWFLSTAFHDDWLYFTFPLIVLCFARSADAWSIDAWRARLTPEVRDKKHYRWPIEAGVFWFGFTYLSAGLAKVLPLEKGWLWLSGVSTQEFAIQFMQESPIFSIFGGTPFDYSILYPFMAASVGTAIVEIGCVMVWFTDKFRVHLLGTIIAMHFGIYLMGIPGFMQLGLVLGIALLPSRWFSDWEDAPTITNR